MIEQAAEAIGETEAGKCAAWSEKARFQTYDSVVFQRCVDQAANLQTLKGGIKR